MHEQTLIEQDGSRHVKYHWLKEKGGAAFAIPMGSLPKLLKVDTDWQREESAYLVPCTEQKAKWADWLSGLGQGPWIGLSWRSGNVSGVRGNQYAPLEAWAAFANDLPGELVCIQYDANADEVAQLTDLSGRTIHVPPGLDQKNNIDGACALLSALTTVVSAPTAVASQSAAVGTPTVKVLSTQGWTNMGADHEPLQPACKVVHGNGSGNWAAVFESAKGLLA